GTAAARSSAGGGALALVPRPARPAAKPPQERRAEHRHEHIETLPSGKSHQRSRILAEEIDGNPQQSVPQDEVREYDPARWTPAPEEEEQRDEQQILQPVIEHHRVPEAFGVGKFHRPPDIGHTAENLAVDEIAEPADAHEERARNRQRVGDFEEMPAVPPAENPHAGNGAEQDAVRGHPAEPDRGNLSRMLPIRPPLVEKDFDHTP